MEELRWHYGIDILDLKEEDRVRAFEWVKARTEIPAHILQKSDKKPKEALSFEPNDLPEVF